ncbi:MAG: hypothetical protein LBJ00_10785 [Planctomycetaceae bacterium]|nr:hypothetical protein [Planctomycetaceae bacterium]
MKRLFKGEAYRPTGYGIVDMIVASCYHFGLCFLSVGDFVAGKKNIVLNYYAVYSSCFIPKLP